jgi:hypothetical protein
MTSAAPARAVTPAPVMVGTVGSAPAEMALRTAFAEADRRGVAMRVVVAGTVNDVFLDDLVARWAERYPGIRVRFGSWTRDRPVRHHMTDRPGRAMYTGQSA